MVTETRGQRIRRLREKLDLSQDLLAELSDGLLGRTDVIHAERDEIKWRSDRYWTGFGKALAMNRTELEDFLDGRVTYAQAFVHALPRAQELLNRKASRRECDAAAREALASAGLTEDEFAPEILGLLQRVARLEGPKVDRSFLIDEARRLLDQVTDAHRHAVARAERARKSHKKESGSYPK